MKRKILFLSGLILVFGAVGHIYYLHLNGNGWTATIALLGIILLDESRK